MSALAVLQNINSWVAIADACSKTKTLTKLSIKDCSSKDGACHEGCPPCCMHALANVLCLPCTGQGVPTFARALGATELHGLDISNFKLVGDLSLENNTVRSHASTHRASQQVGARAWFRLMEQAYGGQEPDDGRQIQPTKHRPEHTELV